MKDHAIVTIVTHSFLAYAKAMHSSLMQWNEKIDFTALVVDADDSDPLPTWCLTLGQIEEAPAAKQMIQRFAATEKTDSLRWALKSQLMLRALQRGAQKVLWCDPDLMFFEDPQCLFDDMTKRSMLLTPHYRALRPSTDEVNFQKNFTEGMFQAGLVGAGYEAQSVLEWWSEACLWRMDKDAANGLYVDQRYLDLLPILWEDTVISRHRGYNIAEWNWHENRRETIDGRVRINGREPVVFIHFTDVTIAEIAYGRDALLRPYLDRYVETLEKFDPNFRLRLPKHFSGAMSPDPTTPAPPQRIRDRIRSRIRRFLLQIVNK